MKFTLRVSCGRDRQAVPFYIQRASSGRLYCAINLKTLFCTIHLMQFFSLRKVLQCKNIRPIEFTFAILLFEIYGAKIEKFKIVVIQEAVC